jgi:hypothetical protein
MKKAFKKSDIKEKLILSLFFKRNPEAKGILDLYLAGSIPVQFMIDTGEIDERGKKMMNWEHNAVMSDKVSIAPKKDLQELIGRNLTIEEVEPILKAEGKGQIDELINLLYYKLNKIYAKSKLYGREIKDFKLL